MRTHPVPSQPGDECETCFFCKKPGCYLRWVFISLMFILNSFVSVTDSLIKLKYFFPPSDFNLPLQEFCSTFSYQLLKITFFLSLVSARRFLLFARDFSAAKSTFSKQQCRICDGCVRTRCGAEAALFFREFCISISICFGQYFPQWRILFIVCMWIRLLWGFGSRCVKQGVLRSMQKRSLASLIKMLSCFNEGRKLELFIDPVTAAIWW